MKCKIPEISWHNRDPVLSVDIQPKIESSTNEVRRFRLASGGTDSHVLIWYLDLNTETGDVEIELAVDLARHQRAVNAVKFSPNGELLASGDDESVIFIWKQKSETETLNLLDNTNTEDKEIWLTLKILRGHMEDVYDLSWSPNSQLLVSGSVDNTAMVWDVQKGKSLAILNDHKGFVQGVAWDPLNKYIATLSTDRYLRIFDIQTKRVVYRINKSILPVDADHDLYEKNCRLYHDDTLQTFFRRLTFTPDGKLLITPSGFVEYADFTHPMETSYIFSRYDLKQPAIVLPSPGQYTVAVRCCPLLFKLREHSDEFKPVVPLPYRMIFAVATRCSVYFYDTQQIQPFAVISNIHYTRLTDITWSSDGRIVVISSTDGFCSLISFNAGELGEEYEQTAADLLAEEQVLQTNNQAMKKKQINKNKSMNEQKSPQQKKSTLPDEEKENNVEYIIDKEILSSAEKFETPAKKLMTAKPIEIRRHPRTPKELAPKAKVVEDEENLISDDEDVVEIPVESKTITKKKDEDEEVISDEDEIRSEIEEQSLMEVREDNEDEAMEVDHVMENIEEDKNVMEKEQNIEETKVEEKDNKLCQEEQKNIIKDESNVENESKATEQNTKEEETKSSQKEENDEIKEKDVGKENKITEKEETKASRVEDKIIDEKQEIKQKDEIEMDKENKKTVKNTDEEKETKTSKKVEEIGESVKQKEKLVEKDQELKQKNEIYVGKESKRTEKNTDEGEENKTPKKLEDIGESEEHKEGTKASKVEEKIVEKNQEINQKDKMNVEKKSKTIEKNTGEEEENKTSKKVEKIGESEKQKERTRTSQEEEKLVKKDQEIKQKDEIDVEKKSKTKEKNTGEEEENKTSKKLEKMGKSKEGTKTSKVEEKIIDEEQEINQKDEIDVEKESKTIKENQAIKETNVENKKLTTEENIEEKTEIRTSEVEEKLSEEDHEIKEKDAIKQEKTDETLNTSTEKIVIGSPITLPNYLSPSQRTPRRVALRTISTPKSKKKILE